MNTMKIFCLLFFIPFLIHSEDTTIAIFKLDHQFSEGHHEPGIQELLANDTNPKTFMSLLNRLRRASKDKNVKACVFYGDGSTLGMAQTRELRKHISNLKQAGKKTYYYSRNLSQSNTFVAAETDKIVLFPEGEVLFNGMMMQNMYFKNLLDKLGLKANVIHIGDFKSAGEPFYLTGPSKESQQQSQALLDDITSRQIESIAASRKMSEDKVKILIDKALFSAKEAKEAGLVDELAFHKDFIDSLKKEYGAKAKFNSNYGQSKKSKIKLDSILDIFALMNQLSAPPKADAMDKISLTVLEGTIESAMGETLRRHILKQAKDNTVKAMILRVNSPGGSAQASEVICQALIEFKKTGKPLIVSMGNVAASGGYYVAVPADTIFAEDLTITGSIGVVGGKLVIGGLLDKIGITTHHYKKGKHADIMTSLRPFNEDEEKILKKAFHRVYATFKRRIKEGRGNKIKGDLEDLAGGRVYTGAQALKIGLIDELGGLRDALTLAVSRTKLKRYKISMFPKQITLSSMLSDELRGPKDDELLQFSSKSKLTAILKKEGFMQKLEILHKLDPKLARSLQTFIQQLELFSSEGVMLIGPSFNY
jgi:protease-4